MAPTLFNLYACVIIEQWRERVKDVEGVGTYILCKLDQQLFRRSTRGASKTELDMQVYYMMRPKKLHWDFSISHLKFKW